MSVQNIVFFLEERSAKEMLKIIVPKIIPSNIQPFYFSFEGKQDLEKNITSKMKLWQKPNSVFIIMRDKDSEDCTRVKERLVNLCKISGKNDFLVRIACTELESFYLGDLDAVKQAGYKISLPKKGKNRFIAPDNLNASNELLLLTKSEYQKVEGSKRIAPFLKLDGTNNSVSFNVLVNGIKRLVSA